jgi:hypothetical protein
MVDPFTMPGSQPIEPERVPLFTIGNLPVQVWAPVEPAYDLHANRNLAANPTWGTTLSINPAPY